MKKIVVFLSLVILSLSMSGAFAGELISETGSASESDNLLVSEASAEISEDGMHPLEMRIYEIRDMDKSELTAEEKQELRKELKDIRREANQPSRGVYISISGLLIVILLILLLR
jgi:hypothetical protein